VKKTCLEGSEMKKKTIANLIMVAIILVTVAAGVLGVGYIRGWFDTATENSACLTRLQGTVNMERSGVVYPVEKETEFSVAVSNQPRI